MTSRRKLEEKIAETKDPVIRKQLQELLDLRNKRSEKRIDNVKNIIDEINPFNSPDTRTPEQKKKDERDTNIMLIIGAIILIIAFVITLIWATSA